MKASETSPLQSFFIALAWWILSALIFSLAYWLTLPLEQRSLARAVNAAFESSGDARRVSEALPSFGPSGTASLAGMRFSMKNKDEVAVVFSAAADGVSASFVAVCSPKKGIVAVLPLDADGKLSASRLPAGLLESYVSRIAKSEALAAQRNAQK